jgi:hypothetical protein
MRDNFRAISLQLIRWANNGHAFTAEKLTSITNPAYLSEMTSGERGIADSTAKQIENLLKLPSGWLDRDHFSMLHMTNLDYELYKIISEYNCEAKTGLLKFLKSKGSENDS